MILSTNPFVAFAAEQIPYSTTATSYTYELIEVPSKIVKITDGIMPFALSDQYANATYQLNIWDRNSSLIASYQIKAYGIYSTADRTSSIYNMGVATLQSPPTAIPITWKSSISGNTGTVTFSGSGISYKITATIHYNGTISFS